MSRVQAEWTSAVKLVSESGGAAADEMTALLEVAAWGRVALRESIDKRLRPEQLARAVAVGMPEPVLTMTGTAHLEVPWSNYIFRVLGGGPRSDSAVGNALARALHDHLAGGGAPGGPVTVRKEVPLGTHGCPECAGGRHSCSLDLVLQGAHVAVGIEHKVKSPPSDFKYHPCGHVGRQAAAYSDLFERWGTVRGVATRRVWLSPSGGSRHDWTPLSHAALATLLAAEVKNLPSFGERYRVASFILDLGAGVIADFERTLHAMQEYRANTESDAAAGRLLAALRDYEHDVIINGVLDAITQG